MPAGYPFTNDDWNRVIMELSYSSGLVWKPTDTDTLRFIFSQGAQLPSLANFGAFLLSSRFASTSGRPDVAETDITNYEIDWDRALPGIGGQFRAAAFYLDRRDSSPFKDRRFRVPARRLIGPAPMRAIPQLLGSSCR